MFMCIVMKIPVVERQQEFLYDTNFCNSDLTFVASQSVHRSVILFSSMKILHIFITACRIQKKDIVFIFYRSFLF
jgi:hypothetical protein